METRDIKELDNSSEGRKGQDYSRPNPSVGADG